MKRGFQNPGLLGLMRTIRGFLRQKPGFLALFSGDATLDLEEAIIRRQCSRELPPICQEGCSYVFGLSHRVVASPSYRPTNH